MGKATDPVVSITGARVDCADGRPAATIDLVEVGGGSQVVTVDGTPEPRIHPSKRVFHVRLLSPDRMLPDDLREVDDYDSAITLGTAYARKLDKHAEQLAQLTDDLKV